jgi:alanine dehydrogenase
MAEVLVLKGDMMKELVSFQEATRIVEGAFWDFYQNKSIVYPAVREMVEEYNGIFGVKSSYLVEGKSIGLKAGGFWKNNESLGKINHQSTMLLFNPETGEPVCLLDANYLTGIRTGAAGAVAAKHLARKNSRVVGLIGAGVQARTQLEGLLTQFPIKEVLVYSRTQAGSEKLVQEIQQQGIKAVYLDSQETVVRNSDIVVTTTPSFSPVIKTSWAREGTHINAMGSDTRGKRELVIDKLPDKVICDLWEQSSIMGELQHDFSKNDVHAEIGELASGEKPGREKEDEITLFDSTGIAIQDLSVATYAYRKAKEMKKGVMIEL